MQNKPESGPDNAGGFFYNPTDPKAGTVTNADGVVVFRSFGTMTYAGTLALVFADVSREDTRVRSALKWAERHWTLDENPGMGQAGRFFFYQILARALSATGHDTIALQDGSSLNWREALARKLLELQRVDPATPAKATGSTTTAASGSLTPSSPPPTASSPPRPLAWRADLRVDRPSPMARNQPSQSSPSPPRKTQSILRGRGPLR